MHRAREQEVDKDRWSCKILTAEKKKIGEKKNGVTLALGVTSPDGDTRQGQRLRNSGRWESHEDLVPTVWTEVIGEVTKHQGISIIHQKTKIHPFKSPKWNFPQITAI